MKKWNALTTKGGKYQRIYRAAAPLQIRKSITKSFDLYRMNKDETLLEEIRIYLIKNKNIFTDENRERIDIFLT